MNVLVYAGPEVLPTSLAHTLSTLRAVVLPHYTVQKITLQSVKSHPWSTNCALLVFPVCRDEFPPTSIGTVKSYLENGGPFLQYSVSGSEDRTRSSSRITLGEQSGQDVVRKSLTDLGLRLPSSASLVSRPTPQFLAGNPSRPGIVAQILEKLSSLASEVQSFTDANDTFSFGSLAEATNIYQECRERYQNQEDPDQWQPKHIIVCSEGEIPSLEQTSKFDVGQFFTELNSARSHEELNAHVESWGMGEALLYGEIVTSTQTMLDKNPRLLSLLPTPLVSLASQQLTGRGRGANVWLSPAGCLQFSLLLRTSLATFPASKLVFVQYLFGLAVVEACRAVTVLGNSGNKVRLKWPNDIYAFDGGASEQNNLRKIGGILVNTNFSGGKIDIVIGCGLNVLNPPPIMSLSQLVPPGHHLSMEQTATAILTKFEKMWGKFLAYRGSFDPFMDLYLERWLHSDQLVTLTTTTPPKSVRIAGITSDHGLLRTVPERTGWSSTEEGFIDLQPDGNSFDLMKGLIRAKTSL